MLGGGGGGEQTSKHINTYCNVRVLRKIKQSKGTESKQEVRVVRKGLSEKMYPKQQQKCDCGEGTGHLTVWGRTPEAQRSSQCKGPEAGLRSSTRAVRLELRGPGGRVT